jgi:hypothetical protein
VEGAFGKHAVKVVAEAAQGEKTTESWSFRVVRFERIVSWGDYLSRLGGGPSGPPALYSLNDVEEDFYEVQGCISCRGAQER